MGDVSGDDQMKELSYMEMASLWIILGISFTAGNLVYWLAWNAEKAIKNYRKEREAMRPWR